VSEEDFFNGYSSPRNKEIIRVFRDLEIVEQLGSGVPRILERYERDVFEIRPNFLRVIFRYEQPGSDMSDEKRGNERDEKRGNERGGKLSVNRRKIVDAMREDPYVTHVRLVELVGIGSTNIEKNIKFLKENGWIRRIGSAKGGHWEVLDE
jgi:predicted HTH transcriptional regulator